MFFAIFLLDAAGNISNEFINNIPIHLIDTITTIAINIANILSIFFVFIPLLFASVVFILIRCSLLNAKYQNTSTTIAIINTYNISESVILNISPTK